MSLIRVDGHHLSCDGWRVPVVLGRAGLVDPKREGDGGTPLGLFPLRRVLYRPDRVTRPKTALPLRAILPDDLWCDDPGHPLYNRATRKPFSASAEELWRDDHAYDLVVVLGHNDDPPVPGLGSAIFIHVNHVDRRPTAGCIALDLGDLAHLLELIGPDTQIEIAAA